MHAQDFADENGVAFCKGWYKNNVEFSVADMLITSPEFGEKKLAKVLPITRTIGATTKMLRKMWCM
jgi:hypothetical protein